MNLRTRTGKLLASFFVSVLLSACGGGGGGGTPPPPPTPNVAPTADAGSAQTVEEGSQVTLNGSASTDSDGTIASYAWSQTGGTAVGLSSATVVSPTFTAPVVNANEDLTFSLTVQDNDGANSAASTVTITVTPAASNVAPTANAGPDQSVSEGDAVTLTGSGSSDTDGTVAAYSWTQSAGPAVTLANADQVGPTFTAPAVVANTDLTFDLVVTDNDGAASSTDSVIISVVPNQAPVANAGPAQSVQQGAVVTLDGSASTDSDGTVAGYAWTQDSGPAVTLTGADQAMPTFTAPTVAASTPLVFSLIVTDNDGAVSTPSTVTITVNVGAPATVEISGIVSYQFVNRGNTQGNGLDYANVSDRPIRGATVQAIQQSNSAVIDTAVSDVTGQYTLTVPSQTSVFVRVRAELKQTGAPNWDVEVRDNGGSSSPVVATSPVYALDGSPADSGVANSVRNLLAETGWGTTSYTGTRASAPFSVLDVIYDAIQLVLTADATATFAPLDAYWSVSNCPSAASIGTSFYNGTALFLLGCDGVDTEEFDTHVIAHEWGHYFEDKFSRSDSVGGSHSGAQRLDMRLAFGEGFGNAISGMIMGNPRYRDTFGGSQSQSFELNVEQNSTANEGWYNESSVQALLYDFFDSDSDGVDAVSLGFGPLYDVLIGAQRNSEAFTSIFPFAESLKAANAGSAANIDALLVEQSIVGAGLDLYGSTETNDAGGNPDVLPIYTTISTAAPSVVCSTSAFDSGGDGNKLGVYRYLRFTVPTTAAYTLTVTKASNPVVAEAADPDIRTFRAGTFIPAFSGNSGNVDTETVSASLDAGNYVVELVEFSFRDPSAAGGVTGNRVCFDVTLTN